MDAVLAHVTPYPDVYSPVLINHLKGMQVCVNIGKDLLQRKDK